MVAVPLNQRPLGPDAAVPSNRRNEPRPGAREVLNAVSRIFRLARIIHRKDIRARINSIGRMDVRWTSTSWFTFLAG